MRRLVLGLLSGCALAGCAVPFTGPLVDAHAHYDPAGQLRPRSGQRAGSLPVEMAQAHVERAALLGVPAPLADAAGVRQANDQLAAFVHAHPGLFLAIATL